MRVGTRMTCGRARSIAFSMAAAAGVGFMFVGGTSVARAAPIPAGADLFDTFTTGDGTGTTGTLLDPGGTATAGTSLESGGGATWDTAAATYHGWQYDGAGHAAVSSTAAQPTVLTNAVPDITGQMVTVQAELQAVNTTYELLALSGATNVFTGNDALQMRLFSDGRWQVRVNNLGGGDMLASGTIANYAQTPRLVDFSFAYNQAARTVSASVDGSSVLSNHAVGTLLDAGGGGDHLTGTGLFAGFRAQSPSDVGSLVDNFAVTVGPVPEPGTIALIGLGGLALLGRKRRQVQ